MYTMSTIFGSDYPYRSPAVIRDGSLRRCNGTDSLSSSYCEFEILFRHDISKALNIHVNGVDVTSVSASGLDSIIVSFRLIPLNETLFVVHWMDRQIHELIKQVRLMGVVILLTQVGMS